MKDRRPIMSRIPFLRGIYDARARICALESQLSIAKSDLKEARLLLKEERGLKKTAQGKLEVCRRNMEGSKQRFEASAELFDSYYAAPVGMPRGLVERTFASWAIIGEGDRLGVPDKFKRGLSAACLYWIIAHGAMSLRKRLRQMASEDAATTAFVSGMERAALLAKASGVLAGVDICVSKIYENCRPAIKEQETGADLLVVLSGEGVVANGGAMLLWMQFKKVDDNGHCLNVYRPQSASNTYQLAVLRQYHRPLEGSYAIYVLQTRRTYGAAGISVGDMAMCDPADEAKCKVNLADYGTRLPELLSQIVTTVDPDGGGVFKDVDALLKYLADRVGRDVPIPVNIVCATTGGRTHEQSIVQGLRAIFDRYVEREVSPGHEHHHGHSF